MRPIMMRVPGRGEVPVWPTGVPGLVVGQRPTDKGECAGKWKVGHARSGYTLPYCLPDPESALSLARALEGVTDWQQIAQVVRPALRTDPYRRAVLPYGIARCVHPPSSDPDKAEDTGIIV